MKSSSKRKIGIFTGYALPHLGGVERYVHKLSASLISLGYEIVVITSNHAELADVEKNAEQTIYRLPIHNIFKNRYPIPKRNKLFKELINKIESENIDYYLLNTRFHLTSLIGSKMGKRSGRPVMLIEHGTDHFTVDNKLLDYFGKLYEHALTSRIKKYVSRYYGVSQNCNAWLEHFGIKASGVFYNSVDKSDRKVAKDYYDLKFQPKSVVITYAGRLIKEKGIINLLEAFVSLQDRMPTPINLVLAGDGPLFEYVKQHYRHPNIHILGRLDFEHVMTLYKSTDIFVYPSQYPEGLPTSILEAGLMKCAIIATARGGTEEVIPSNDYGIIVDGSVESLKIALKDLVLDGSKRRRLANNVGRRVESVFAWEVVANTVNSEIKRFGN